MPGRKVLLLSHNIVSCNQLKQAKAIFFLLCFLIGNSGIAVSAHWCGGKLTHISFLIEHDDCACGKKEAEMNSGCCKDKVATLKAEDDLNTSSSLIIKAPTFKDIVVTVPHIEIVAASLLNYSTPDFYRPPPGKPKLPSYLLNRAFLI